MSPINKDDILFSSAHDMRNSLGFVLREIDNLEKKEPEGTQREICFAKIKQGLFQFEEELATLLSIYKLESSKMLVSFDYVEVSSFLQHNIDFFKNSKLYDKIDFKLKVEEELFWFFDENLLSIALKNALNNAVRYVKKEIVVTATVVKQMLQIKVEDDGDGFDSDMLEQTEFTKAKGKGGIGFLLSDMVAKTHKNKEKHGYLKLAKSKDLTGASWQLFLP